jgi:hypothetical protein
MPPMARGSQKHFEHKLQVFHDKESFISFRARGSRTVQPQVILRVRSCLHSGREALVYALALKDRTLAYAYLTVYNCATLIVYRNERFHYIL